MQVASATEAQPGQLELRLPVDGAEAPFAYPNGEGWLTMELALAGGGYASLVLATTEARAWAGEAFAAISTAYREATGDRHALSEEELAVLAPATSYWPGEPVHVWGEGDSDAILRFHVLVDIAGEHLGSAVLHACLVEHLSGHFDTAAVRVSAPFVIAGRTA